ncbi:alpha/beta hydrolase [Marinobacter sp. LN3S78]|uniref:alpha/beta hydrolase n=1 Tax=Marinobacter sp. LN3S78 TaxID=3382300 RepID=UPI00387B3CAE
MAARLLVVPRRLPPSDLELEFRKSAEQITIGDGLRGYSWGKGPTVLLAHGWEGRATQMASFVDALVSNGFRVLAVDAPAHGQSPGTRMHVMSYAEALCKIGESLGELQGVIGHSAGGNAVAVALSKGLKVRRAVLIAPQASVDWGARRIAPLMGLKGRALDSFPAALQKKMGVSLGATSVPSLRDRIVQPVLIIHDISDKEVPVTDGQAIADALPNAQLEKTEGLGHRRILKAQEVTKRAAEFLAEGAASIGASGIRSSTL